MNWYWWGWSLALGGWSTFWAARFYREHRWWAAGLFTALAIVGFGALYVVDYVERHKSRPPRSPS